MVIWIHTPIAALAIGLVAAVLLWLTWRPSRQYVRKRDADATRWQRLYSGEDYPAVEEALLAITSAFLLRPQDVGRLEPSDKLMDIYRAAYPAKGTPDALEFETLWKDLRKRPGVSEAELASLPSMTVGDVVEMWRRRKGAA